MTYLRLTTVRDLDGEPIATVDAQFVTSTHLPHTWMVIATPNDDGDDDPTGHPTAHLDPYGPFTTDDGARAWAEAHFTPYPTRYTVVPLTAPYTYANVEEALGKPVRTSPPRPARASTVARYFKLFDLTRLRYGIRADTPRHGFTARELEHPELGPVVELTALGPDRYQRDRDHDLMKAVLRLNHPRYEVTDKDTHLLVRRLCDAELHARADQAAARVTPHLAALTTSTPPPAPAATRTAAETADALFHAVLDTVRETTSDNDPDDYNLMLQLPDMAPRDALTVLKQVFLPRALAGPLTDVLAALAPHTYAPKAH